MTTRKRAEQVAPVKEPHKLDTAEPTAAVDKAKKDYTARTETARLTKAALKAKIKAELPATAAGSQAVQPVRKEPQIRRYLSDTDDEEARVLIRITSSERHHAVPELRLSKQEFDLAIASGAENIHVNIRTIDFETKLEGDLRIDLEPFRAAKNSNVYVIVDIYGNQDGDYWLSVLAGSSGVCSCGATQCAQPATGCGRALNFDRKTAGSASYELQDDLDLALSQLLSAVREFCATQEEIGPDAFDDPNRELVGMRPTIYYALVEQ